MKTLFYKYQATGNDFILFDNRRKTFPKKDTNFIAGLCHRRFGIGGDGLILLEDDKSADFGMRYYNSDGNQGSMCGNGGRCIVAFAKELGLIADSCIFSAVDGDHRAELKNGIIALQMQDVSEIHSKPHYLWLDTGSPHHVQLWEKEENLDVKQEGRRLRYGLYGSKGSNINFVFPRGEGSFMVRTYERGVEDETYSCGTGVTATALAMHFLGKLKSSPARIETLGGNLLVRFKSQGEGYTNIWLEGPAEMVFKGEF